MTNAAIRRKILELLYENRVEHPYNRMTPGEFKEAMTIGLKELHFNIIYLEEKGYVELQKPLEGTIFVTARITAKGVDIVENEYDLNVFFPEGSSAVPSSLDLRARFDNLLDAAKTLTGLSAEPKELLIEELIRIRDELASREPGYSVIKENADRVRQRSSEVWQKLSEILNDPAIARALGNAARKELGM
ncbi:hypothetical protein IBX73_04025 [candidate division WOR-3 bacterium]|nr:hypothetical protein [candidate division WOR-3 bacterium]